VGARGTPARRFGLRTLAFTAAAAVVILIAARGGPEAGAITVAVLGTAMILLVSSGRL
jgi:hypothetical protein